MHWINDNYAGFSEEKWNVKKEEKTTTLVHGPQSNEATALVVGPGI